MMEGLKKGLFNGMVRKPYVIDPDVMGNELMNRWKDGTMKLHSKKKQELNSCYYIMWDLLGRHTIRH